MKNEIEEKLENLTKTYEAEVGNLSKEWAKLPDEDRAHSLSIGCIITGFGCFLAGLEIFIVMANLPVTLTFLGLGIVSSVSSAIFSRIASKSLKKAKALRKKEKAMWNEYCEEYDKIKNQEFVFVEQEAVSNNPITEKNSTIEKIEEQGNDVSF